MAKLLDIVKPGVVTGEDVQNLVYAKANNFAIPAVNCVGSDSVNAVVGNRSTCKSASNYSILKRWCSFLRR